MIGILVVALLACAALAYVIVPLRRPERGASDPAAGALERARENKEVALTAIVDLEEEAEVGKLSQTELETLRIEYEHDALQALEQMDALGTGPAHDDPLEAEIDAMRKRLACPSCGAMREPGGTCSRCDL